MKVEYHVEELTCGCDRQWRFMQTGKWVLWLMIINTVIFALVFLPAMWGWYDIGKLLRIFGQVNADLFSKLMLWQLVTAMFLHGGIGHLINNMFALWVCGSSIENEKGAWYFLKLYFISGIGAGLLAFCVEPGATIPCIGASGAIFGLIVAFGILFHGRTIYVFFIPVKVEVMVGIYLAIEIFCCISFMKDGIGHWAHISGGVIGALWVWWSRRKSGRRVMAKAADGSSNRFDKIEL